MRVLFYFYFLFLSLLSCFSWSKRALTELRFFVLFTTVFLMKDEMNFSTESSCCLPPWSVCDWSLFNVSTSW